MAPNPETEYRRPGLTASQCREIERRIRVAADAVVWPLSAVRWFLRALCVDVFRFVTWESVRVRLVVKEYRRRTASR